MKNLIAICFLIISLTAFSQKNKSNDLLFEIAAEVNQDSLTSYILSLQNIGTRYALADNTKEVALWIKGKFESFGYENVMLDSFLLDHNGMQVMQYNVICRSDSIYSHNDYVLLGAHHDAITYTTPMDSTPGADDNASGVAGVLETARILKMYDGDAKNPFHFATWGAEELGLHGSIN
ncbi:MAG: M28 family peptidase, partial [Salinivirgaceae bacterium]